MHANRGANHITHNVAELEAAHESRQEQTPGQVLIYTTYKPNTPYM